MSETTEPYRCACRQCVEIASLTCDLATAEQAVETASRDTLELLAVLSEHLGELTEDGPYVVEQYRQRLAAQTRDLAAARDMANDLAASLAGFQFPAGDTPEELQARAATSIRRWVKMLVEWEKRAEPAQHGEAGDGE